jgi:hypothetical protein
MNQIIIGSLTQREKASHHFSGEKIFHENHKKKNNDKDKESNFN